MLGIIGPVLKPLGLRLVPLVDPVLSRRITLYARTRKVAPLAVDLFSKFAVHFFQPTNS